MLPRNRRVSKSLFNEAMKGRNTLHSPHIMLRLSSYNPKELSRCAITISKKVANKASTRNTLRRKLSSYIEPIITTLPNGYILIISLKKGITEENVDICREEVRDLIQKAVHLIQSTHV